MIQWEQIPSSQDEVWRAKIQGGWLLKMSWQELVTVQNGIRYPGAKSGVVFVPDPNHEWDGTSLA
jgi:hypothetical protein